MTFSSGRSVLEDLSCRSGKIAKSAYRGKVRKVRWMVEDVKFEVFWCLLRAGQYAEKVS